MQIHNLKRIHKNKKKRLVGRGGKHAKTAGRGGKGQTARAGNKIRPALRDIIKKIPKHRGYKFNSFQIKPVILSLDKIAQVYKGNLSITDIIIITPKSLLEAKVIKRKKGMIPQVKILNGKLPFDMKIQLSKCLFSASAKEKIIKAGGEILKN
jgi:large subunit ribosomal protein L15